MDKKMKQVNIYTDGGCLGNPGKGGYGVILIYGEHRTEISKGFKHTTNNRMELMACIAGLESLKYQCEITLFSDSKYVVDSVSKGWAKKWQKNNWMRNSKSRAENIDLWERLLSLIQKHKIKFVWVKGHSGHPENERCDELAKNAANNTQLLDDKGYRL